MNFTVLTAVAVMLPFCLLKLPIYLFVCNSVYSNFLLYLLVDWVKRRIDVTNKEMQHRDEFQRVAQSTGTFSKDISTTISH